VSKTSLRLAVEQSRRAVIAGAPWDVEARPSGLRGPDQLISRVPKVAAVDRFWLRRSEFFQEDQVAGPTSARENQLVGSPQTRRPRLDIQGATGRSPLSSDLFNSEPQRSFRQRRVSGFAPYATYGQRGMPSSTPSRTTRSKPLRPLAELISIAVVGGPPDRARTPGRTTALQ